MSSNPEIANSLKISKGVAGSVCWKSLRSIYTPLKIPKNCTLTNIQGNPLVLIFGSVMVSTFLILGASFFLLYKSSPHWFAALIIVAMSAVPAVIKSCVVFKRCIAQPPNEKKISPRWRKRASSAIEVLRSFESYASKGASRSLHCLVRPCVSIGFSISRYFSFSIARSKSRLICRIFSSLSAKLVFINSLVVSRTCKVDE